LNIYLHLPHALLASLTGNVQCGQVNPCTTGLPIVTTDSSTFTTIFQIVFGILAAVCVLMIVLAGFRFVTGRGDPQEMAKARNTIIFALIGLVIALAAEAVVGFVIGNVGF